MVSSEKSTPTSARYFKSESVRQRSKLQFASEGASSSEGQAKNGLVLPTVPRDSYSCPKADDLLYLTSPAPLFASTHSKGNYTKDKTALTPHGANIRYFQRRVTLFCHSCRIRAERERERERERMEKNDREGARHDNDNGVYFCAQYRSTAFSFGRRIEPSSTHCCI